MKYPLNIRIIIYNFSLPGLINGTNRVLSLCDEFNKKLILSAKNIRAEKSVELPVPTKRRPSHKCPHHGKKINLVILLKLCYLVAHNSCSSSDEEVGNEESEIMEELNRKIQHPFRLHRELWHNEPGEMNDGPLCKCSIKAKRSGIRHGFYAGEPPPRVFNDQNVGVGICKREAEGIGNQCDPDSNNAGRLYHYRITISPPTNFLVSLNYFTTFLNVVFSQKLRQLLLTMDMNSSFLDSHCCRIIGFPNYQFAR